MQLATCASKQAEAPFLCHSQGIRQSDEPRNAFSHQVARVSARTRGCWRAVGSIPVTKFPGALRLPGLRGCCLPMQLATCAPKQAETPFLCHRQGTRRSNEPRNAFSRQIARVSAAHPGLLAHSRQHPGYPAPGCAALTRATWILLARATRNMRPKTGRNALPLPQARNSAERGSTTPALPRLSQSEEEITSMADHRSQSWQHPSQHINPPLTHRGPGTPPSPALPSPTG